MEKLDQTGQEDQSRAYAKVNRNFDELKTAVSAAAGEAGNSVQKPETPAPYSVDPADIAAVLVAAGLMAAA